MMVNLPCLKGSVSQLPSYHLFIHRVPTKLSNGVMLHGVDFCRLQLLFVPESSLTNRWHQMVLNMSADAMPALSGGGLYRCGAIKSRFWIYPPESSPISGRCIGNPVGFWKALTKQSLSFEWIDLASLSSRRCRSCRKPGKMPPREAGRKPVDSLLPTGFRRDGSKASGFRQIDSRGASDP